MPNSNPFIVDDADTPNRVLFAASEIHPLIKTGGLADVAGSLPLALHHRGVDVRLIMPAYPQVIDRLIPLKAISTLKVPGWNHQLRILKGTFQGTLPIYLIDAPGLFDRIGNPYLDAHGHEWSDNALRFSTFCRAIVAIVKRETTLKWQPNVLHLNDWQCGLVPALLAEEWERPATLFTVHNLSYQGNYREQTLHELRLSPSLWSHDGLEFHGNVSFIKGGLAFSDRITTVSPTYARQILTPELGYGLEGLLKHRSKHLYGILNGVDYSVWNPATDPHLERNYGLSTFAGKRDNKIALQKELGLEENPNAFLLGHVGRTVEQKGVDLIVELIPRILASDTIQLAVLGSGDSALEHALSEAAKGSPDRISATIGYDERLAHRIEAGSEAFLMPSRFEPCGLNQMYSLRYGTPPIVHRTGGLADTVINVDPEHTLDGSATGFVFEEADAESLWKSIEKARELFMRPPMWWERLATTGMKVDYSWDVSAAQYEALYTDARLTPAPNPLAQEA